MSLVGLRMITPAPTNPTPVMIHSVPRPAQSPSSFNVRSMNQRHAIIRIPKPAYRTSITTVAFQPVVMFPHAAELKLAAQYRKRLAYAMSDTIAC